MLVHGGPWVRDVWGFDAVVQFLANRGYAVLQINYRGSTGYGSAFVEKARAQVGGAIQDDIADAVRLAIQKGIADPSRVAIMGGSYGGYSTLFALGRTPELYRCGIDVAGVTDWPALMKNRDRDEYKIAYAHWVERVGDLKDDTTLGRLAAASPVNFADQIKAPLLIVHGDRDATVPVAQTKAMVAALTRAGHKPETLFFGKLGHAIPRDKDGVAFLNRLETFLAAHLGK
jgi:dipeptidyl aminopeptidase/acylaminoacyl peptidase